MNYAAHYAKLMERSRERNLLGYVERHHIIPRCLGGGNEPSNIAVLTPEEHYIAHQLLVKMHPKHHGLTWAAVAMTNNGNRTQRQNKLYGWLRRLLAARVSEASSKRRHSEETRRKMAAAKLGKKRVPHSEETRQKMSNAAKGKPKTAAHVAASSAGRTGLKRGPPSAKTRALRSVGIKAAWARGAMRQMTPELRLKQSADMTRIWAERKAARNAVVPEI